MNKGIKEYLILMTIGLSPILLGVIVGLQHNAVSKDVDASTINIITTQVQSYLPPPTIWISPTLQLIPNTNEILITKDIDPRSGQPLFAVTIPYYRSRNGVADFNVLNRACDNAKLTVNNEGLFTLQQLRSSNNIEWVECTLAALP